MGNEKLDLAWRLVENTGANVFITGKAGTGKTTFLKKLKEESSKTIAVLAPTGIAALNAGGMTIHSFFQLSFSPYIPGTGQTGNNSHFSRYSNKKIKLLRSIDTIVIDEISMVRADVLDAIDAKLRRYRNGALPMGGIQLVMIGDIQQLPPVAREEEWRLLREHYRTPYFFDSHLLHEIPYETIELTKVYRQKDHDFLHILNSIRENKIDSSTLTKLNARYNPDFHPSNEESYIRLMTHNKQAQRVNAEHLAALQAKEYVFEAEIEGEFPELIYPAEHKLPLKEGAQVMFLKNDTQGGHRYYNGTIGRVKSISDEGKIIVTLDDNSTPIEVEKEIWENISYTIDEKTKEMKESVVGRFTQIPLRAAWAITIHKSQGLTFDKAIINASSAFAHGQAYVALSRCLTLEGLILEKPLPISSIICDENVSAFESACHSREATENKIDRLQKDFIKSIDLDITDLTELRHAMERLHRALQNSHAVSFPKMTATFGELLNRNFKDLFDISLRFKEQLRKMYSQGATHVQIHDRLKSASSYFLKELLPIFSFIQDIPLEVDNKESYKKFLEAMEGVENESKLKEALMIATLEKELTSTDYLKIKRNISLAPTSWIKQQKKRSAPQFNTDVENAELYKNLTEWRNRKAIEEGVAPYMVLGNKSLVVLSNDMPEDEDDLLSIPGIGKKKLSTYGKELIEIIDNFRRGIIS